LASNARVSAFGISASPTLPIGGGLNKGEEYETYHAIRIGEPSYLGASRLAAPNI